MLPIKHNALVWELFWELSELIPSQKMTHIPHQVLPKTTAIFKQVSQLLKPQFNIYKIWLMCVLNSCSVCDTGAYGGPRIIKTQRVTEFRCDLCDLELNSESMYFQHIQGQKHMKRLKAGQPANSNTNLGTLIEESTSPVVGEDSLLSHGLKSFSYTYLSEDSFALCGGALAGKSRDKLGWASLFLYLVWHNGTIAKYLFTSHWKSS